MKDQYFGDFGDYQKISLLKSLKDQGLGVLVHWMKTTDDGSSDGKHIAYLERPEIWRVFHPEVYDYIKSSIGTGRSLSHIERSPFCSGIEFLNEHIEEDSARMRLHESLLTGSADIVFFDPDNGIEVASSTKRTIHKYVQWDEMTTVYGAGKSLIVYQHFGREDRQKFIMRKLTEIQERLDAPAFALQVKHSVYFLVPQPTHAKRMHQGVKDFTSAWGRLASIHSESH